jgi:hypothetical protein
VSWNGESTAPLIGTRPGLADALGLAEPVRELFAAAAHGRRSATDVLAAREGQVPGAFQAAATRHCRRISLPSLAARLSSHS